MIICRVPGCGKPQHAKHLCNTHYHYARLHDGNPIKPPKELNFRKAPNGYLQVYVNGKSRMAHRYLLEEHLGKKLLTTQHVHHINGDKTDNRIENLLICSTRRHGKLHRRNKIINGKKRCTKCEKWLMAKNFAWNNGNRHSYCRLCMSEYHRQWHQRKKAN